MVRVMKLDRATPSELAEALDELASIGYADTFPHISQEETVEADAAAFIRPQRRFCWMWRRQAVPTPNALSPSSIVWNDGLRPASAIWKLPSVTNHAV